jgi:hypothetical protein
MTSTDRQALAVYNVRDFAASGRKADSAQAAIQAAIDACAAGGGGTVYFPPGAYTTGTLHLRSHVRLHLEAGATLYSSKDPASFSQNALFYAEDVEHISLEGRGTVDGQAEYVWAEKTFRDMNIFPNQVVAEKYGVPLVRAFPTPESVGHLVLFIRCRDVRIEHLSFLHSPSWTMHLWGCQRVNIDGVYIFTSREAGVWADGIDPDGCQDVRIANCTIDTGDDALVFYSSNIYGPAQPCENITVTNCRLSSSSSALKFCDVNYNAIRNVTITNCVITDSNRGLAFMVWDGGVVENVVVANLTVACRRHAWFWWGDAEPLHFNVVRRSTIDPELDASTLPPIGHLRNVLITNLIAHGPGPSRIQGDPASLLENVTIENARLTIDSDLESPWKKKPIALTVKHARQFTLKDVEFAWEAPGQDHWQSALVVQEVEGLTLDGVSARPAPCAPEAPAIVLRDVAGALVRHAHAQPGTGTFLQLAGAGTHDVSLFGNDLRQARTAVAVASEVDPGALREGVA